MTVQFCFIGQGREGLKVMAQSVRGRAHVRVDPEGTFSMNLASMSLSKAPFICKTWTRFLCKLDTVLGAGDTMVSWTGQSPCHHKLTHWHGGRCTGQTSGMEHGFGGRLEQALL